MHFAQMILSQHSTLLFSGRGFSDIGDDSEEDADENEDKMVAHVQHDSIITAISNSVTPNFRRFVKEGERKKR
jgi:hypothetical protein